VSTGSASSASTSISRWISKRITGKISRRISRQRFRRSLSSAAAILLILGVGLAVRSDQTTVHRGRPPAPRLALPNSGVPTAQTAPQPSCSGSSLPSDDIADANPGVASRLNHDSAGLDITAQAVTATTTLTAESVCGESLAPFDTGMTNVTKGPRRGYRFLPHMTFGDTLTVTLPYDPKLIPPGLSDNDVQTFYYDETAGRWQALERVSIDPTAGTIVSHTISRTSSTRPLPCPTIPGRSATTRPASRASRVATPAPGST
jgi:hypothetical protein